MSDIIICTNRECLLSYSCYRFNCETNSYKQVYEKFYPEFNEETDKVECKFYIDDYTKHISDSDGGL